HRRPVRLDERRRASDISAPLGMVQPGVRPVPPALGEIADNGELAEERVFLRDVVAEMNRETSEHVAITVVAEQGEVADQRRIRVFRDRGPECFLVGSANAARAEQREQARSRIAVVEEARVYE